MVLTIVLQVAIMVPWFKIWYQKNYTSKENENNVL